MGPTRDFCVTESGHSTQAELRAIRPKAHSGAVRAIRYPGHHVRYPLKPGQGAKDYKQALNYSLAPGTYTVAIKISGQTQQTETIELAEGSTWGIIALPMAGCLPIQLF